MASAAARRATSEAPKSGQPWPRSSTPGDCASAVTSAHTWAAPCPATDSRVLDARKRVASAGSGASAGIARRVATTGGLRGVRRWW